MENINALNKLLSENYDIKIKELAIIDSHFGTEIFSIETNAKKYIVKTLPLYVERLENEGRITEYLYNNGISVARLLKTRSGNYCIKSNELQLHVQEFIEGRTLSVNTAPDWFMEKSACTLGKIHNTLKGYDELKVNFGNEFFNKANIISTIKHYNELLAKAIDENNISLANSLEERVKHLERISSFDICTEKLTYSNSHGDFHIGQIITENKDITVIDWTSASRMPICLEVINSYITEDPACVNGKVNIENLKKYLASYLKYFPLNNYDIKMMPYVLYYQQLMCHYQPPYNNIPDTYKPICNLINCFTKWLYDNVDALSRELLQV